MRVEAEPGKRSHHLIKASCDGTMADMRLYQGPNYSNSDRGSFQHDSHSDTTPRDSLHRAHTQLGMMDARLHAWSPTAKLIRSQLGRIPNMTDVGGKPVEGP